MNNKGSKIADAIVYEYKRKKQWEEKLKEREQKRKENDINGKSKN